MAKIHKSPNIFMDSERSVSASRPRPNAVDPRQQTNGQDQSASSSETQERSFSDVFKNVNGNSANEQKTNLQEESSIQGQSYASVNRSSSKEDLSVHQILRRAEDEAERIIAEARQQASMILQQNRLKVLAEKQAGYQEGFREGQVAAQVMYEQQLAQIQKSFHEIASELSRKPEEMLNGMEEELLDLSLDVAGKVIGLELSRKNKAYHVFLRKALDRLKKQEKATVYLNEREYQLFVAAQPEMFSDENGSIQFVGDDKLEPGSCLIETARGRFDASANIQLERIGKAMRG